MSERTIKEILFTADGIKDKPMETDEQWELLYNKAAAERDKLKAQRDGLLAALRRISERDPQSYEACGLMAPEQCAVNCEGCIARAAIEEAER